MADWFKLVDVQDGRKKKNSLQIIRKWVRQIRFGLVSLLNGISSFVGYLMPKLFFWKNSSSTI